MPENIKCRDCNKPAIAVDLDYDEGYCEQHFREQQSSSEPVTNFRSIA